MAVCNALCSVVDNFSFHVYALPAVQLAFVTLTNREAVTSLQQQGTTLQERYSYIALLVQQQYLNYSSIVIRQRTCAESRAEA